MHHSSMDFTSIPVGNQTPTSLYKITIPPILNTLFRFVKFLCVACVIDVVMCHPFDWKTFRFKLIYFHFQLPS